MNKGQGQWVIFPSWSQYFDSSSTLCCCLMGDRKRRQACKNPCLLFPTKDELADQVHQENHLKNGAGGGRTLGTSCPLRPLPQCHMHQNSKLRYASQLTYYFWFINWPSFLDFSEIGRIFEKQTLGFVQQNLKARCHFCQPINDTPLNGKKSSNE